MKFVTTGALLVLYLSVAGCGLGIFRDRENDYLESEVMPPLEVPEKLDRPAFVDLMEVPEVVDSRGISGREFKVPLPDPLNTSFGVEMIVIKRLGDAYWIFVDAPPAVIWPKLNEFWEVNNLAVARSDPGRGLIESEWLLSSGGDAEAIFASLKAGGPPIAIRAQFANRFQLRITPGVRSGSSEIYLRYKQVPAAAVREEQLDWSTQSDDLEVEEAVLSAIAYYLGDTINEATSVSLLAGTLSAESKAILVPDDQRPVLKYKLDFARAWATVGAALATARINVEDLDRSAATYFIYYRSGEEDRPGFIRRLFTDDDELPAGEEDRYLVHLSEADDGIDVTVLKDPSTLASAAVAERLLSIIKEASS